MTSVIEKLVAIIAPHHCLGCGIENNILCNGCIYTTVMQPLPFCSLCGATASDWQLCKACRDLSKIRSVYVGSEYGGLVEKAIKLYKFGRTKDAYNPLTHILDNCLPYGNWLIVPIPTVPHRVRQRGYDQTMLLASNLARCRGLTCCPVLRRQNDLRQLGASRSVRLRQLHEAFYLTDVDKIKNQNILLIDDVCTTGATLSAAARFLRRNGAGNIDAAVVAGNQKHQD